jgi:hypothetical protein
VPVFPPGGITKAAEFYIAPLPFMALQLLSRALGQRRNTITSHFPQEPYLDFHHYSAIASIFHIFYDFPSSTKKLLRSTNKNISDNEIEVCYFLHSNAKQIFEKREFIFFEARCNKAFLLEVLDFLKLIISYSQ